MSKTCLALALIGPLLLLSACSDNEPDDPAASASSTSSANESPTVDDVDYPDEGVELAGAPALEGVYARGLQTYVDFERGRRLAARDGKVGRLLTFNATADVVDPYREALAAGSTSTYDGPVVIEFLDAQPRGSVLRLDVCVDATGLEVPAGAPPVLGEATRAPQLIEVRMFEGLWRVTTAAPRDGTC